MIAIYFLLSTARNDVEIVILAYSYCLYSTTYIYICDWIKMHDKIFI